MAFDWRTLQVKPLPAAERQVAACRVVDIQAAPEAAGMVAVRTHCGCVDCDDGGSYAIDPATESMRPIFAPGRTALTGQVLLGTAVVTTVSSIAPFLNSNQQDLPRYSGATLTAPG